MLEYVYFTVISTFNLTPSTTGTTCWDGCKTLRFDQLVQLVTSCPSSLALQYREIVLFCALVCAIRQPLRLVVLVVICCFESLSTFLGCSLCSTSLRIGECVLTLLGELLKSHWELVQLVCLVSLKCNGVVCVLIYTRNLWRLV